MTSQLASVVSPPLCLPAPPRCRLQVWPEGDDGASVGALFSGTFHPYAGSPPTPLQVCLPVSVFTLILSLTLPLRLSPSPSPILSHQLSHQLSPLALLNLASLTSLQALRVDLSATTVAARLEPDENADLEFACQSTAPAATHASYTRVVTMSNLQTCPLLFRMHTEGPFELVAVTPSVPQVRRRDPVCFPILWIQPHCTPSHLTPQPFGVCTGPGRLPGCRRDAGRFRRSDLPPPQGVCGCLASLLAQQGRGWTLGRTFGSPFPAARRPRLVVLDSPPPGAGLLNRRGRAIRVGAAALRGLLARGLPSGDLFQRYGLPHCTNLLSSGLSLLLSHMPIIISKGHIGSHDNHMP